MVNIKIKTVLSTREIHQVFKLRRDTFVKEQILFKNSDRDKLDNISSYLLAYVQGKVVGTVRVYPDIFNENSWIGGRLAVQKDFRKTNVGRMLVKSAEKFVFEKGAIHFSANIQLQNVTFFKKLRWRPKGEIFFINNKPHVKMKADLKKFFKISGNNKNYNQQLFEPYY